MNYKDYSKMTTEELNKVFLFAASCDNNNAMLEINAFKNFYGKTIKVIKGRKVPLGTCGKVFYVARKNYSSYPDRFGLNSVTILGFKDENGKSFF